MAEIKTFKNPLGLTSHFAIENWDNSPDGKKYYEIYTEELGYQTFPLDEWDIEVTFTRKPKPVEPGQWRTNFPGTSCEESVYVLAVHGQMAWVSDDPDGLAGGDLTAWSVKLSDLG